MTELSSVGEAETGHSRAAGIARGAGVIAGITMLARMLGLIRTLAFSQTVGATCLGSAYFTASQVPDLVAELVLGGALGSAMVPVLARSAERSFADPAEKAHVSQITSALLAWTMVILIPLTLTIGLAAGPISAALTPANPSAHCVHSELVSTTASMLRVFAPQAFLYGLTIVFFGLLQAYRRFAAYALAPLVASVVLISSYLTFDLLSRNSALSNLSTPMELVLSGGATLGVAGMVVVGAIPTARLRLRLRPAFRFPPGVARRAGGLVSVGLIEVIVQQTSAVAVIALANGRGETGALVMFNYASQVFNSLNAVLALSIVLSAFPVLSSRDGTVFDRTCAGSTRAVLLVASLGMALVAAVAIPAAQVLATHPSQVPQLIEGFVFFAPGLVGAGVLANVTRALLAIGRLKVACVGVAGSSLLAAVAQIVLAEVVPTNFVVGALALGNSIGMVGAAIPMVMITRRIRGRAAVEGVGRTTLTALAAAIVSAVAGLSVSIAWPTTHKLLAIVVGVFAAAAAVIAFGAVAYILDNGDLKVVVARLAQTLKLRPPGGLADQDDAKSQDAIRQVPRMSSSDQHKDAKLAEHTRHGAMMTRLERQCAICIGLAAGIAGGIAVFTTSNQAGTAFLLLISLIFLVMGVEGTALVRGFGADALRLRRRSKERQQGPGPAPASAPDPVPAADKAGAAGTDQQDMSYEEVMAALTDERQL
ncbi:MAG TPA: lipid II flippase MurJ [Streptosporangiaceae bacterium]|nr:lipid II flippase MurJ [Streptosporangiaceae bacterium]